MAQCFSKYLTKHNGYIFLGLTAFSWLILKRYKNKKRPRACVETPTQIVTENHLERRKPHIDLAFFKQLWQIIKIVIPGWYSIEAGYILLVAIVLLGRSLCDLWMVHHLISTESLLISLQKHQFFINVLRLMVAIPFLAVTNNMLRFAMGALKIQMRNNLCRHLYKGYLKNITCYRLSNLDGRIKNVDHILTVDVDKFCESLAECFSNISKPLLDIGIFAYKVSANISVMPPIIILAYTVLSGALLTYLRKPVGHMTMTEQKIEGQFRHDIARIAKYGEEIAFYNGNVREKANLLTTFDKLIFHTRKVLYFQVILGWIDNMVAKYSATLVGWISFAFPLLTYSSFNNLSFAQRTVLYYKYGLILLKMAVAVGRLILSGRELARLTSFTYRITQLQQVLKDVNEDKYERGMTENHNTLDPTTGKINIQDNVIKFNKVPVVTPNGDVLIKELSLEIHSGMNVLVCGPNGAGKSSIFRILGELWPLFGGELTKPQSGKLFYIPQKPYMTLGSLRDQITYPQGAGEAKLHGCTDEQLKFFLNLVQLEYLLEREGSFDVVADWLDILSGGEKQRIAMARLFYHAPQFAILDECTSAVSVDIENIMYTYCRKVGITLLTVSHRKSLWKHHEYVLYLDGQGSYTFSLIDDETEKFGS